MPGVPGGFFGDGRVDGGADPLVRAGPPWTRTRPAKPAPSMPLKPTGAPAADQEVRPTKKNGPSRLGPLYPLG